MWQAWKKQEEEKKAKKQLKADKKAKKAAEKKKRAEMQEWLKNHPQTSETEDSESEDAK